MIKQLMCRKLLIIGIFALASCANTNTNYREYGLYLARQSGFESQLVKTDFFDLTAFIRITNKQQPINLYIEGDGFAWATKYHLSNDPTPHDPVALKLAIQDPYANVIYLARPCQYKQSQRACTASYWSDKRFSTEVIKSLNQAINQLNPNEQSLDLIGYSGGAAIAVLIASQRSDINSIRTVAGNLDHQYVNEYHHVNQMPESLNAIDVASKVQHIPQIHFIGDKDKVVPKETVMRFISKFSNTHCAKILEKNAYHLQGWENQWQELILISLPCK